MKVNQIASYVLLLISLTAFIITPSCEKKNDPPQECKTCTARDKGNETLIKEQQVCNTEQEQLFRNQYSPREVTVTCR